MFAYLLESLLGQCLSGDNWALNEPNESTPKVVTQRSIDVTQIQQERPQSPTVTLTWRAGKYKVHKLHRIDILMVFFMVFL